MSPDVAIVGRGKVGRALARALSPRVHRGGREPASSLRADLVIFAVRDGQLGEIAARYAPVLEASVVLHVAGSVDAEVLAPLRPAALGQWHPVLSFVDGAAEWAGAAAVVRGDERACEAGRRLCDELSMRAIDASAGLDLGLYHAALALSANGMAALAATAQRLLVGAGVPAGDVPHLLGPLLGSVACNIERLGPEPAMSGPVRRGDVATIQGHVERLRAALPEALPAYRASVGAQLAVAHGLGEASMTDLDAISRIVKGPDVSVTLQETDEGVGA